MTAPRWRRLLLTGAVGEIGSVLRPALRGAAGRVRLHDLRPVTPGHAAEEAAQGDLAKPGVAETAMQDMDCVIHLAGIPQETGGTPEQILHANVLGTHAVFEAARRAGMRRVIFASSNHVIGFHRVDRAVGTEEPMRPDGHYGLSKVCGGAALRRQARDGGGVPADRRFPRPPRQCAGAGGLGESPRHGPARPMLRGRAAVPFPRALRRVGQQPGALGWG